MGADICTLVTLYTVLFKPFGYESSHTALLVSGCTLLPCTILDTLEYRHLQQVAVLRIDRTHNVIDERRIVIGHGSIVRQLCPCWVYCKLLVLTSTVDGSIILLNDILALLAIALDDEFLHLLYGEVYGG